MSASTPNGAPTMVIKVNTAAMGTQTTKAKPIKRLHHGSFSARAVKEPWGGLLMCFALVVCVPIAAVFTFMTIVGAPLGVLALILYAFFLLLSVPMAGIVLGAWMLKLLKKTGAVEINWQRTVLGVLLYTALGFIPVIGWVLKLALILSSLGAFSHYWYRFVWLNR